MPYNDIQGEKFMFEDFFYNRLIKLRMDRGVSQREMRFAIGQNAGYITKLESKASLPSMTVFFYICEYFGITMAEFFDDGTTHPLQVKALLEEIRGLDSDSLELLTGTAKKMRGKK